MKLSIVRSLLSLILLPPAAVVAQSQTMALSWFTTPDGSTGIISVIRQGNPPVTTLFYSTCVETDDSVCQEGQGNIPSSAFVGTVQTSLTRSNVLSLLADTTIPGFSNWLCVQPNYDTASCDGGTAPATGGLIQVTWTKGSQWARITTANDKLWNNGSVVQATASGTYAFYATMRGTFMGTTAQTAGITTGEMLLQTGSTTSGSVVQTLAARWAKGRAAIAKRKGVIR